MKTSILPFEILMCAFPGLSKEEAEDIIGVSELHSFPPNTVVCCEGAYETTFYIILEGEVEVTKLINPNEVRVLKHLRAGDFFGEMAIIHNSPRAATVTTVLPTTTLVIQKEAFSRLLETNSSLSLAMIREVSRRLRENDEMAIEDLRLKAKELAEAYQQLAELDFARRQFLTTIAHELRTPLMAASGYMQVILSGKLQGETLSSALNTVGRNLQDIITLVNDILFLQEMDLILPEFQPADIGDVIAIVVEQQRAQAERNRVDLKLVVPSDLPPVNADSKSLVRAFAAILNNAIKFSPDGGEVLIEISHDHRWMHIMFQDHGVGIPLEALPKIFDRFFHLDNIGGRLFRGIGLGLSIARQVIEQHQGSIEVQSEPGKGSIFTVHLPLHTQSD